MKIGIDIDDTICDTFKSILPSVCEYYGYSIEEFEKMYEKDADVFTKLDDYSKYARIYYPRVIPYLPLFKHTKEVIDKLKEKNKIVFITARSTLGFDDSYKISYDYLKANDIYFDELIVGANNKYEVCKKNNIDIFIDNSISNCEFVSKLDNVDVLLFENKYNEACDRFKHVKNWDEIYDYVSSKNWFYKYLLI